MSETSRVILEHRSIRQYLDGKIDDKHIDTIIRGARNAPNSINGQSISVINVKDETIRERLIQIASNQTWIKPASHFFIFCIDFHKAQIASAIEGKSLKMPDQTEAIMLGSLDVGLAMGNAIAIAESLGYGTVPIGAIRNNPREVISLLKLPKYVFPIAGLVVGIRGEESAKKPRLPMGTFFHEDTYNTELKSDIEAYNETMSEYMKKRTGGKSDRNWSQTTVGAFSQVKHPDITPVLKEQGFLLK